MKILITILFVLALIALMFLIGCASTLASEPEGAVVLKTLAEEVITKSQGPGKVEQSINDAEISIEIANQVIPFKNKFNKDIRAKVAEADNLIAESRKAYISKDYSRARALAIQAKIISDEAIKLSKQITDKQDEEKRLMVEYKIKEAKKLNKNTFEAENYMEQKNYDKALEAVNNSSKIIIASQKVVVKNDNLWNIAKKKYGDGSKWIKIWNVNINKIANPNLIFTGQVLDIPVFK